MECSKSLFDKICKELNRGERIEHNKETISKVTSFIWDDCLASVQTLNDVDLFLEFSSLEKLTNKQAKDLASFQWSRIFIWNLKEISDEQLEILSKYEWKIEIGWFVEITDKTTQILKNFTWTLILNFSNRCNISTNDEITNLVNDVEKCLDGINLWIWYVYIKINDDKNRHKVHNLLNKYSLWKLDIQ